MFSIKSKTMFLREFFTDSNLNQFFKNFVEIKLSAQYIVFNQWNFFNLNKLFKNMFRQTNNIQAGLKALIKELNICRNNKNLSRVRPFIFNK